MADEVKEPVVGSTLISAADLDNVANEAIVKDATDAIAKNALAEKAAELHAQADSILAQKKKELDAVNSQIDTAAIDLAKKSLEDDEALREKTKEIHALDKEISEKRRQLEALAGSSSTKGNHSDSRIHRDPYIVEKDHVVPDPDVITDSTGQIFDANVHHLDGGKPYVDSTGKFVAKEIGYRPPVASAAFGDSGVVR